MASGVAWVIATEVFGHDQPFFAPVSAIITLGLTMSQRGRRAVEVALGVAVGIAVGDLLVLGIGVGPAQLALVVILATAIAIFLGSGQMLATQAAVSAALVATLQPPTEGVTFARFLDALVGGTVALIVSGLVLPADPMAMVRRAARPLLEELADTLDDIAVAIVERDRELADRALLRARGIDELSDRFAEAVNVSRETTRYAPVRRRHRGRVEDYADAAGRIDLAVRNVRVLARGMIRAVRLDENVPPQTADAVRHLTRAVRAFADALENPDRVADVREAALQAAATASRVLEEHRQPVGERDRRPGAVDRQRPARRDRDERRRGRGGDQAGGGRGALRRARDGRHAWHTGHQYVVRPPTVARSSAVPHRGHRPPRTRCGFSRPVCAPPPAIASRSAARTERRSPSSSLDRQLVGGPPRIEPGAPQDLVRQQVPDAGDHALIEQARLHRRTAAPEAHPERVASHLRGVRPDVREVRLEHRPAEPALVAQRHPAAVRELEREAVPVARRGRLVDHDPARHAEVQPEVRPAVGLRPQELPAPVGRVSRRPTSAAAISPGACGRQTYVSRSSTATISRPSTRSSCCRARSASGSSGISGPLVAGDLQPEGDHRAAGHRSRGRGANARRTRARSRPPTPAGSTRRS